MPMSKALQICACGRQGLGVIVQRRGQELLQGTVIWDNTHTYPCVQDRKTPCKGEAFYKLHIKGKGVSFILRNGSKKTFIYAVNCAPNRKLMNVKYKIMNGQPVLLVLKNIACGEQLLTMYDSSVPNMFP